MAQRKGVVAVEPPGHVLNLQQRSFVVVLKAVVVTQHVSLQLPAFPNHYRPAQRQRITLRVAEVFHRDVGFVALYRVDREKHQISGVAGSQRREHAVLQPQFTFQCVCELGLQIRIALIIRKRVDVAPRRVQVLVVGPVDAVAVREC